MLKLRPNNNEICNKICQQSYLQQSHLLMVISDGGSFDDDKIGLPVCLNQKIQLSQIPKYSLIVNKLFQ